MAKLAIKRGSTSKLARVFIQDSSQTDGRGLTGLVFNSSGLTGYYIEEGKSSATAITLATATVGTFTSSGFKEVDATNLPGVYEIGIPNAALDEGNSVLLMLKGATNMAPCLLEIELDAYDPQDATAFGISRLDASVSSRLPTSSYVDHTTTIAALQSDTDDIQTRLPSSLVSGRIDASVGAVASGAITASALAADALTAAKVAADVGAEIATAVRTELATELARIDAAITSRLATAGYTAPDNVTITAIAGYVDTEVAAIKAKTDNLPASPAAVGSAMTLDMTQTVSDVGGAANTLGGVLALIRAMANGKMTIASGVLKLFGQNGTTQVGIDRTITGTVPTDTTRA